MNVMGGFSDLIFSRKDMHSIMCFIFIYQNLSGLKSTISTKHLVYWYISCSISLTCFCISSCGVSLHVYMKFFLTGLNVLYERIMSITRDCTISESESMCT
jgi:hypothetical protein